MNVPFEWKFTRTSIQVKFNWATTMDILVQILATQGPNKGETIT